MLRILAVQLIDRQRSSSVISAISSGGQSGLLSMLLHRAIASVAENNSQVATTLKTTNCRSMPFPLMRLFLKGHYRHGLWPSCIALGICAGQHGCVLLLKWSRRQRSVASRVVAHFTSYAARPHCLGALGLQLLCTLTSCSELRCHALQDSSGFSMQFVEALLGLVSALSSSSSGCNALAEAGIVPALLPLIKDQNPEHIGLLGSAVRHPFHL